MRINVFFIIFFSLLLQVFISEPGQCGTDLVILYSGDTIGHIEPCG